MPRLSSEQEPSNSTANSARLFGLLGVCGALAVLLQTSVLHHLPFVPDILLILCVYLGIYHASIAAAASAFLLGYALDSCAGAPVGIQTVTMSLAFAVATLLSQRLWMNNPFSVFGLIACAVLLKAVTFLVLLETPWVSHLILSFLTQYVLWDLLFALLLTPLIFALLATGERTFIRA